MHLNLTFSSPINLHKWLTSYIRIYTKRSLCKMQAGGASSIAFQVLEMQLSGSTSLIIQLCASAFQAAADASRSCWIMQKRQKRCNRTILTTLLLDSCCMSSLSGCGSKCVCAGEQPFPPIVWHLQLAAGQISSKTRREWRVELISHQPLLQPIIAVSLRADGIMCDCTQDK